jgi:hypothetical protein
MSQSTTIDPALLDILENCRPAFPNEPGPSAEDLAYADAEFRRKFGPDEPRPIRDSKDLLIGIGDHLASLGLEPDIRGDEILFEFLGRVHRLELEDLESRGPGISPDERAMIAAGLPVG